MLPKYIYCVIQDGTAQFGEVQNNGVSLQIISCDGLACVVSEAERNEYTLSDTEHIKAHARVLKQIEKVTELIPVRYGTVAPNEKEIHLFLKRHKGEFKNLFTKLRENTEIKVEVSWKVMPTIFEEIAKETKEIRILKQSSKPKTREQLIRAGQIVATKLNQKRETERSRWLGALKGAFIDYKFDSASQDERLFRGSFLIQKNKISEFDRKLEDLESQYRERCKVKCIGPSPPYSFLNLSVHDGRNR